MKKNIITKNKLTFTIYSDEKVFGDGCHTTTQGMLNMISQQDMKNKKVLDLGTGSGILSVFSVLKGCTDILAIDANPYVFEFVKKNFEINNLNLDNIKFKFNYLTDNINEKFDIVFANLPGDVQFENMKTISNVINKDGILIMSLFHHLPIEDYLPQFEILDRIENVEYDVYTLKLKN